MAAILPIEEITEFTDGNLETSPAAFLIGSSTPSRDASQKFNSWLLPGAATSQVTDTTGTELYNEAQAERDPERRAELLADINRRAHEEASLLSLHRQYSIDGHTDRLAWQPSCSRRSHGRNGATGRGEVQAIPNGGEQRAPRLRGSTHLLRTLKKT